jgi:hypothetical protein
VLPIEEQTQQPQAPATAPAQQLLTGDLGVVVLQALLECGVGYVVSSWRDQPTPIDAAIDDARDRVLAARGVVLRRLRSLSALEPIVTAPTGGITGEPPRGAVVFGGRRGLRPALERFVVMQSSGAVVGLCFDEEALLVEDALVIDPEPTAGGIMRAIHQAFEASNRAGRPALVVLRERALGMRGTIRRSEARTPGDAAGGDAQRRGDPVDVAMAACASGLVEAHMGTSSRSERVVYCAGPMRIAVERALAQVGAELAGEGHDLRLQDVAVVANRVVGVVPPAGTAGGRLLTSAEQVLVLAPRAPQLAARLRDELGVDGIEARSIDAGKLRGEQLVRIVAQWLALPQAGLDTHARELLERIAAACDQRPVRRELGRSRLPRRADVLHRSVSPTVAAGLALAQGVVGVPGRLDPAWPTYRTDTGVPLTVTPAATFAQHGMAAVAPESGVGVVVVVGQASGVLEQAGAAGASVEHVDGSSPRAIGRAIATACRAQRASWHVIMVGDVQRVAAPRRSTFGMDPDLVGTERIATAAVPTSATVLVDLGEELDAGPAVLALDRPEAVAALEQVRELSPATWDLLRRPARGRGARAAWNLRRQIVRAASGVEL